MEAWLAMQDTTLDGLRSAVGTARARYSIRCIQLAVSGTDDKRLVELWSGKTPDEAFSLLSHPEIAVTNQSDVRAVTCTHAHTASSPVVPLQRTTTVFAFPLSRAALLTCASRSTPSLEL